MSTQTITEFLEARIAEDEALSRQCNDGPWFYNGYSAVLSQPMMGPHDRYEDAAFSDGHSLEKRGGCNSCSADRCNLYTEDYHLDPLVAGVAAHHGDTAVGRREHDAEHIARHDPARVLAECAAKRAIVESFAAVGKRDLKGEPVLCGMYSALGDAVADLAAVYADHADYQQEWAL